MQNKRDLAVLYRTWIALEPISMTERKIPIKYHNSFIIFPIILILLFIYRSFDIICMLKISRGSLTFLFPCHVRAFLIRILSAGNHPKCRLRKLRVFGVYVRIYIAANFAQRSRADRKFSPALVSLNQWSLIHSGMDRDGEKRTNAD